MATESFSGTLSNWAQWYPSWGNAVIDSGQLQFSGGQDVGIRYISPLASGPAQFSAADISEATWTNQFIGVGVRVSGADTTRSGYFARVHDNAATNKLIELVKYVNGTPTVLASTTFATGSAFRIRIDDVPSSGNAVLSVFIGSTQITALNFTDSSSPLTVAQPGVIGQGGTIRLDNWEGDNYTPVVGPVITGPSGSVGATSISHSVNENQNNAGTWTASGGTAWSLSGTDASLLNISSTGVVTLASGNFDRETKSSYSFTVNRDAVSQSVTLTIANVNEAPVFSGTIAVPTLTVGVAMTPVDFASFFSDVDVGDTASYSTVGTWPAGISIVTTSIAGTPSTSGTFSNLRVRRTDSGGLTVDSNVFNIVVSAAADTTPPVFTGSVSSSSVGSAGANISWPTATDNVGVTGYEYRLNGGTYTSVGNVISTSLSGLTPSTLYNVDVRAFDAAGNRSSAITGSFTTLAATDTTPPTLTGSITIGTVTQNSIQMSWPAGSDNVAVTGYEVSSNGGSSYSSVGNVTSHTFTGLTASTSYGLRVRARDAAGNVSAALSATQSTTSAPTPPPPPPPVGTKRIVVVLTTNGTLPAASLVNLKWAFFDQATPDLFNAPVAKGATELTDASGVLEIDVSASTLAIGQTGWLVITNSDGTIFQNPPARAFSAPVQVVA